MQKYIYSLILLFALGTFYTYAQKENSNWFFGDKAALTWNTTTSYTAIGVYGTANTTLSNMPTKIIGSPLTTHEGCYSISDVDANLLFFSDGMTIWNKNMDIMANGSGLTGDPSSAQSGIIFPYPYNINKYIAVTLGAGNANNLSYSIVDMSKNSGLGEVDLTKKNILLTGQSGYLGETVAAVRHSNRNDFWIVAPGRTTTNSFLNVWKVTSAGVQTARHSFVNVGMPTTPDWPGGYIKFTSDGQHFVWVDFNNNFFVYGDFNPSTGIISKLRIRTGGLTGGGFGYGVDFSTSGKYLYLTYAPGNLNVNQASGLLVYDFTALLATSAPNTINPIKTITNPISLTNGITDHFGAIQTGPDGRMYIPKFSSTSMFVIDNPEDPVNMKIYKINNILTGTVTWGLPNFAAPWFRMEIDPPTNSEVCAEVISTYKLTIHNGMGFNLISKIIIDFGDGSPDATQTITNPGIGTYTQTYRYRNPGTYTITITAYNASNGVELTTNSTMKINSCVIRCNPHIRGVNK